MMDIILHTLPKNIQVRIESAETRYCFGGDYTQIQQVLINLCINAADAMPDGGTITLGYRTPTSVEQLRYAPDPDARYVWLMVRDTGIGMNADTIKHIFEPFFTTKERSHGTGLGLSIACKIVQNHNGWIEVESQVGQGATFVIGLPEAKNIDNSEEKITSVPKRKGQGEHILIVEDEPHVREFLVEQ